MELIIGRDGATGRLKVVNQTNINLYGEPASVPGDVSRKHCQLTIIDNKTYLIKNIKAENVTWVNGVEVQAKRITNVDKVQLGRGRYTLPLRDIVDKEMASLADISPLREIWEDYNNGLITIRKRQQSNNLLSRIPIAFTMLGGLLSAVSETIRPFSLSFTVIAVIVMAFGFYRVATDKSIEKQEVLKKKLQQNYVCPKCKHFMGYQDYDLVSQNSSCPYCKTPFIKS